MRIWSGFACQESVATWNAKMLVYESFSRPRFESNTLPIAPNSCSEYRSLVVAFFRYPKHFFRNKSQNFNENSNDFIARGWLVGKSFEGLFLGQLSQKLRSKLPILEIYSKLVWIQHTVTTTFDFLCVALMLSDSDTMFFLFIVFFLFQCLWLLFFLYSYDINRRYSYYEVPILVEINEFLIARIYMAHGSSTYFQNQSFQLICKQVASIDIYSRFYFCETNPIKFEIWNLITTSFSIFNFFAVTPVVK